MKHSVRWLALAVVALVLVFGLLPLRAAFAQESIRDKKDVVDTAIAAGDFTTLVQAVDAAGLVETLKGQGPFTLFAPTDEAFAALPAGTLESLLADPEALQQVLTYHVLPGRVIAAMINDGDEKATVQGENVMFSFVDGQKGVNDAKITVKNLMASNGVIHVIDKVLLPPSMSGAAAPEAAATETVTDTAAAATEIVTDTVAAATEAVTDTAAAATEAVTDTVAAATEIVTDTAAAATEATPEAAATEATPEAAATEAATEAPVAEATEAPAPESLPTTGGESNNLLLLAVVGFVLLGMSGLAVAARRRTA